MSSQTGEETINIETSKGTKVIKKKDIIHFPDGLPGFSEFNDFVVFDIKGCQPFKSMLSVKYGGPDFIVIDPFKVFEDYAPFESLSDLENLDIGKPTDLAVFAIVTISDKPEKITVNLRGPVFLNLETHIARQMVLADEKYPTKMSLSVN